MPLTVVQTTPRQRGLATLTVTIPFSTPPVVGNALVVPLVVYQASSAITPATLSCADNRGNVYTLAVLEHSGQIGCAVFLCPILTTTTGPFTVTVSQTSSSYFETCAIEVSGVGAGLAVNRTVSQIGIGTAVATGTSAALTSDEAFIVGVMTIATNQSAITVESVSPAWVQAFENLDHSTSIAGEADQRIRTVVTGTAQACAWTASTGTAWAAALAALSGPNVTPTTTAGTGALTVGATGTTAAIATATGSGSFAFSATGTAPILTTAVGGASFAFGASGVLVSVVPLGSVDAGVTMTLAVDRVLTVAQETDEALTVTRAVSRVLRID